ncbi:hypothetical protein, partial [Paenibacillus ginsengihumi]|uniref:hypothetical protein n=1 Tax=Paenibacillus ginsengihumi TaxID=431596 RepID=UPI001B7F8D39
ILKITQGPRPLPGLHRAHETTNLAKNATFTVLFAPEEGECCILCNNLGAVGFKSGNIAQIVALFTTLSRK